MSLRDDPGRDTAQPGRGGIEPDLEPDVERLHRAILREPGDPTEGREPVPWWVWATAAVTLFWAGWYLGRFGGTLGPATHVAIRLRDPVVTREVTEQRVEAELDPVAAGEALYRTHCGSCHQPTGLGLPGVFPPIVGSEWETGPPETVVRILLHGLSGPIEVAGQTYNGVMPPFGGQLSDAQIAALATFVRQWKPNAAGPVDPALVARLRTALAARTSPWTADELRAAEQARAGPRGGSGS